jgi:hypothetical protein
MRKPSYQWTDLLFSIVVMTAALAFSGCIWDFQEGCDEEFGSECECPECDDYDPPDEQDTGEEEEETQSYWDEHDCDNQVEDDPCQQAICEAIESYQEALDGCVEVEEECNCTFLEDCLVVYIECIGLTCVDQYDHDVGGMIDCSLTFAVCVDPC